MTIPLILLVSLLALCTLSLLARRSEDASGTLRLLTKPLSMLGQAIQQGATACKEHLKNALDWPPRANVIARLVDLVLALCVFAGDFALARLRSAAFFGVPAEKLAWLPLDSFSGLLWLCVSALWGIVLFDLINLIPPGWRLIPVERLSRPVRFIATLFALVLFIVSALTLALFFFWGQVQINNLENSDTTILGLNISLVFGSLLGLSSAVALWALFVGLAGVYIIAVALLYLVLRILSIFAPSPIATTGDEVTPPQEEPLKPITLIHLDSFGSRFSSWLAPACIDIGTWRLIRLQAHADLSRPTRGGFSRSSAHGARDITPHEQIKELIKSGTPQEQAYARIAQTIVNSIVDSFTRESVTKAYDLIATKLSLIPYIAPSLQDLHRLLPSHSIIIVTQLSEQTFNDRRSLEALETLRSLWEEETILTVLLTHNRSDLANRAGAETQGLFQARTVAGLLDCHEHSLQNPSFGEVFEPYTTRTPFITFSFASAIVSSGNPTLAQNIANMGKKEGEKVGKGDLANCISQTIKLYDEIGKPGSLAMVEQGTTIGEPQGLVVTHPISLDDKRSKEYRNAIEPPMTQIHPQANLIVVRGEGTPEYKDGARYHVQVAALRPLILPMLKEAQAEEDTPLVPETPQAEAAPVHVNSRRRQQNIA